MITDMLVKLRALIEDSPQEGVEVFEYTTSNIFTLAESNIIELTDTTINGEGLGSGQSATFDEDHKVTVIADFEVGDLVQFEYTFYNHSDESLIEFIRAALVWLSIYDSDSETYIIDGDEIIPAPSDKTLDLICIIASIIVKPDYIQYKLPNVSVTYPVKMNKEDKIKDLVTQYKTGVGAIIIVTYNKIY